MANCCSSTGQLRTQTTQGKPVFCERCWRPVCATHDSRNVNCTVEESHQARRRVVLRHLLRGLRRGLRRGLWLGLQGGLDLPGFSHPAFCPHWYHGAWARDHDHGSGPGCGSLSAAWLPSHCGRHLSHDPAPEPRSLATIRAALVNFFLPLILLGLLLVAQQILLLLHIGVANLAPDTTPNAWAGAVPAWPLSFSTGRPRSSHPPYPLGAKGAVVAVVAAQLRLHHLPWPRRRSSSPSCPRSSSPCTSPALAP